MKTECRTVRALLSRLLDDDLPDEVRLAVEAHLKDCAVCRRERELLVASWELLGSYEAPQVSDGFTASLMQRVRSERVPGEIPLEDPWARDPRPRLRQRRRRLAWAMAAAILAAAGIGAIWGWIKVQRGTGATIAAKTDTRTVATTTPPPAPRVAVRQVTDDEVIRDLEIYENLELLRKLELLSDFEVVEKLDGAS